MRFGARDVTGQSTTVNYLSELPGFCNISFLFFGFFLQEHDMENSGDVCRPVKDIIHRLWNSKTTATSNARLSLACGPTAKQLWKIDETWKYSNVSHMFYKGVVLNIVKKLVLLCHRSCRISREAKQLLEHFNQSEVSIPHAHIRHFKYRLK